MTRSDLLKALLPLNTRQKNPEFALRVFAGLMNREEWRLVLVGKGELMKRLRGLVMELGVGHLVVFAGEVQTTAKYYGAFDVLMVPSLHEGLGMVVVEAGAAGLPVVASDQVPAEANVVKNTHFLSLRDLGAWRKALEVAVKGGRMAVKRTAKTEEYNINDAVKKLEELYESFTH